MITNIKIINFLYRYVFWYHEKRMVNYDGSKRNDNTMSDGKRKGLVSVETITPKTIIKHPSNLMMLNVVNEYHHTTKSTLTIKNATPNDAGNYTCKPSNAVEASIQVFVSEGKHYYFYTYKRK